MSQPPIAPDHERIKALETAVEDFRSFFDESQSGASKALKLFKHQFRKYYFVMPPLWRIGLRMASKQERMLPEFTSTGAIRSGTSTLSSYILQHPCIVPPLAKELGTHIPRLNYFHAQFPSLKEKAVIENKYGVAKTGDCTPMMPSLSSAFWMKAVNPNIKFVIILRNPVDRAISHWRWSKMLTRSFEDDALWSQMPDFKEAVNYEIRDYNEGGGGFRMFCGSAENSILRHSIYLPFLRTLYDNFDNEKIKIVNASDLFSNTIEVVKDVYDFLELPNYDPVEIKEHNPSPKMHVDDETRAAMSEFFKPHNEKLYEFVGKSFDWE